MMLNKKAALFAATLALFGGVTHTANAQIIAADSYKIGTDRSQGQYTDGNSLASTGAINNLVTQGFTTTGYGSGTGTAQFQSTSGGLGYAPLGITSADSGKVTYAAAGLDNNTRSTARLLTAVPSSSTYWFSSLVNRGAVDANSTGRDYVLSGFGGTVLATSLILTPSSPGVTGLFYGFTGDTGNLAIRYRSAGGSATQNNTVETVLLNTSQTSLDNNTYALIFKVESAFAGGVADRLSYWVNPTSFTNEASLTSSSLAKGVLTDTNILSGSTDFQRLTYVSHNYNSSAFFDEQRFGTTLASVAPGASVTVPEAGSVSLLLVGGLSLMGVVLRKRKAA